MPSSGVRSAIPRPLATVLLASLLVKLALLVPAHHTNLFHDSLDYCFAAVGLIDRGEYESVRAPGYPAMLAAVFAIARTAGVPTPGAGVGHDLSAYAGINAYDLARLVQVLLSTVTVFLLFLLVRQFFDQKTAIVAAALAAFYPNLVVYSHYLWSETLFIFLMISGLLLAAAAARHRRIGLAIACGLVLGLGALTRQIGLVVVGVVAVWVWIDVATANAGLRLRLPRIRREDARVASLLMVGIALAAIATVAPFSLRNIEKHGELVLISATGGQGLLFGATDHPMREISRFGDPTLRFDGFRRDRRCRERAVEIIRADPAGWLRRCFTHNIPSLFQPLPGRVMTHLLSARLGYGAIPPAWLSRSILVSFVAAYAVLSLAAAIGLWSAGERRYTLLFVLLLLGFVASHAPVLGVTRHRLPIEVMATAFAAVVLSRGLAETRAAISTRRLFGLAVTLLVMVSTVAMSPTESVVDRWNKCASVAASAPTRASNEVETADERR